MLPGARAIGSLLCKRISTKPPVKNVGLLNFSAAGTSSDAFRFVVQNILSALNPTERGLNLPVLTQFSDYLTHEIVLEVLRRSSVSKGMQFFQWARKQKNYQHDAMSYEAIIRRLCSSRQCKDALLLMQAMRSDGLVPTLQSLVELMKGYAEFGQMQEAIDIFNYVKSSAEVPAEAYSYMINGLARVYRIEEALALSKESLSRGLKADHHTLLFALNRAGRTDLAADVLELLLKNKVQVGQVDCSVVVDSLSREGALDRATSIFHLITETGSRIDSQAFNILASRFFKAKRPLEVVKLFALLAEKSIVYSDTTYKIVVDGLCKAGMIFEALELVQKFKDVYTPTVFIYNGIINGFCRTGKVLDAYKVFEKMVEESVYPNVFTYTILLNGFCKAGKTKSALEVFSEMKKNGCSPNPVTYGTLIQHLCRVGEIDEALRVMIEQRKSELPTDVISCTTIVGAFCKANRLDEALKFIDEMRKMGVEPNEVTYSNLVNGFCSKGEVDKIIQFFEKEKSNNNGALEPAAYPGYLDALCKGNHLDQVKQALEELRKLGVAPDVVTYSTLINTFAKVGNFEDSFLLLEEMRTKGVKPDVVTYTSLINMLCKLNKVEDAYNVLEIMEASGITPNVITYNSMLDGFCKNGKLDQVHKIYEMMMKKKCTPDVVTYSIIMDGLSKAGSLDSAVKIFELMKENQCPDAVAYNIMISNLVQAGNLEEAYRIYENMKDVRGDAVTGALGTLLTGLCDAGKVEMADKLMKMAVERGQCESDGGDFVEIVKAHSKSKSAAV